MQNPLSMIYTGTYGTPSVGVSLKNSTMLLTQSNHPVSGTHLAPAFRWEVTDTGLTSGVRFVMAADISGHALSDLPEDALRRMVCLYMISHLNSRNLREAFENLTDIYKWQINSQNALPSPERETYSVTSSHSTETQRTPFVFE